MVGKRGSIYRVATAACYNCDITCKTCSGPLDTECVSCHPWATLNITTGKCEEPCHASCATCTGPGINECVTCTDVTAVLTASNYCCHSTCLSCSGSLATECTSCPASKYLTTTNKCDACDVSCLTCNGATATDCVTCPSGSTI